MPGVKILLTGATGYIGGSVLSALLDSKDPNVHASQISVLIRGGESRAKPFKEAGLKVIPFEGLDDSPAIVRAASEHDVVIGTTLGYHTGSALSILEGLAKRKAELSAGSTNSLPASLPCYIHTDGTSNIGDQPISGDYLETKEFSDVEDDMYEYMRMRQTKDVYIQRTTSIAVIDAGKRLNVPTYTMMAPTIYGGGAGARFGGNTLSVMIPIMMRSAIQHGQAAVIGDGRGVRDQVHVLDLAQLYLLLLAKLLAGDTDMPSGERGIFFSVQGRYTWKEVAEGIATAGYELGALKTKDVTSWSLEKAAEEWSGDVDGDFADSTFMTELGLASNAKTKGDYAAKWGWKPQKTQGDWQAHFKIDFAQILAKGEKA